MIKKLILFCFILYLKQVQAQIWEPVSCFNGRSTISRMFVDSLHNKIILNPIRDYNICNNEFKGIISYNGNNFNDLDFGIDAYDTGNKYTIGSKFLGGITYKGKTLFGGYFSSVGSNAKPAEALALWDGAVWDTFPKFTFKHNPYFLNNPQLVNGFFEDNDKLWIYGQFDSLGGIPGKNLYTFDGNNFEALNIPTTYNYLVNKIVKYKNEIYISGAFYNFPFDNYTYLIKYKNGVWSNVASGVSTSLGGIWDMIVYQDTLYIGGEFAKADNNAGNHLMKWDGTKFHDAGFGNFYDWGGIRQLIVFKDRLYTFGRFKYASDKKAFGAAYYKNGKWTVNSDSLDNVILSAVLYNNDIYISGGFRSIQADTNIAYFARLRCPDLDNCPHLIENPNYTTNLFPNPANTEINLSIGNDFKNNSTISIFNGLGQLIFKSSVNDGAFKLNCETWPKGLYLIVLQNSNTHQSYKVIKE